VENSCYYKNLSLALTGYENRQTVTVFVAKGELSKVIGQKRRNVTRLKTEKNIAKILIKEDPFLEKRAIRVE
jgi:predicted RNA-binding protein YlqC (UPF0109 family)